MVVRIKLFVGMVVLILINSNPSSITAAPQVLNIRLGTSMTYNFDFKFYPNTNLSATPLYDNIDREIKYVVRDIQYLSDNSTQIFIDELDVGFNRTYIMEAWDLSSYIVHTNFQYFQDQYTQINLTSEINESFNTTTRTKVEVLENGSLIFYEIQRSSVSLADGKPAYQRTEQNLVETETGYVLQKTKLIYRPDADMIEVNTYTLLEVGENPEGIVVEPDLLVESEKTGILSENTTSSDKIPRFQTTTAQVTASTQENSTATYSATKVLFWPYFVILIPIIGSRKR